MKENYSKKYILFQKLHLRHFLFLAFFIVSFLKKTVQTFFEINQKIALEFLQLYMFNLGDMLSVIPYKIMKKRMKKEKIEIDNKEEENENVGGIKYIYISEAKRIKNSKTIIIIILLTIIDFIAQISSVIYLVEKEGHKLSVKQVNLNATLVFRIIFVSIFSICILHTKFYRHNLFSFSIDIICLIILAVIDIKKIYEDHGDNITMSIIYILIRILNEVLYSLVNVLAKYIFLFHFISTYYLLIYKSIFDFFYLIIFSFPFIFIKLQDQNGESKNVFSMLINIFEDAKYFAIVLGFIIVSFLYNNLIFKIIDIFSPNHFIISRLLENFGMFLIDLMMNGPDKEGYLAIRIIMYIILIIASFIYNEFLVINICGLSKNTKLFLDYEVERENIFNKQDDNRKSSAISIMTELNDSFDTKDNEYKEDD